MSLISNKLKVHIIERRLRMSVSTLCRKAKESVYAADMLLKSAEIALEEAKVAKDLSSSVFESLANNSEFISEVTAAKEAFEASEMGLKSSEIAHQAASVAKIKAVPTASLILVSMETF